MRVGDHPLPAWGDSWHCLLLPWLSWPHLGHGKVLYSRSKPVLEWGEQGTRWLSGCGFLKDELSLPGIWIWKDLSGEFLELQAKQ